MRDFSATHQHLAVLCASVVCGNDLARIEQTQWVKGFFQGKHLRIFFCRKLHTHAVELFNAHTMLTRDRAAHCHTGF